MNHIDVEAFRKFRQLSEKGKLAAFMWICSLLEEEDDKLLKDICSALDAFLEEDKNLKQGS